MPVAKLQICNLTFFFLLNSFQLSFNSSLQDHLGYKILIFLLIGDALQLFIGKLNYGVILCQFIRETMTWAEAWAPFPGKLCQFFTCCLLSPPFSWCPHQQQVMYPTHTHRFKCVTLFMANLNFSEESIELFCHYLPTPREACILASVSFVSDSSHTMLQRLLKSFTHSKSQLF